MPNFLVSTLIMNGSESSSTTTPVVEEAKAIFAHL
ncbi:hypothetical protein ACB092_12G118000 [Castanea dentata]